MSAILQLVFRSIEKSNELVEYIEEKLARLGRHYPNIIHCRTVLSLPHRSKRQGNEYRVGIGLTIPKRTLTACARAKSSADQDLFTAVSKAFLIMESQLRKELDKRIISMPPLEDSPIYDMAG